MKTKQTPYNFEAMGVTLESAKHALEALIDKVSNCSYEEDDFMVMASDFQIVLYKLCLAWHYKYMSDSDIKSLSTEEFLLLSRKIPNFGLDLQLMSGLE